MKAIGRRQEIWGLAKALFATLVLVAAWGCGEDGGGSSLDVEVPSLAPLVVFEDNFTSGTLGNWEIERPTAAVSVFGNPAPSLLLVSTTPGPATASSTLAFSPLYGLSLTTDIDPGAGNAAMVVSPYPHSGTINTYVSVVGSSTLYAIAGTFVLFSHPSDGQYHRYTFSISPSGQAAWSRDGVVQLQLAYPAPNHVRLSLQDLGEGTSGSRFDNVRVTFP